MQGKESQAEANICVSKIRGRAEIASNVFTGIREGLAIIVISNATLNLLIALL